MIADPRTTLARPDLADRRLEGMVRADRYAAAEPFGCAIPSAGVRRAPDAHAEQDSQLLFGEVFEVLEQRGDWAWGQARRDGYVGYVARAALGEAGEAPSHWVRALRTIAFEKPDFKSPTAAFLSMNALVTVDRHQARFVKVDGLGWVFHDHLAPIGRFETDPAAAAERFLGAPYQWGGRESLGLDCSGLIQQALFACGRGCPRDADMQARLGRPIPQRELKRGDLVGWDGHIAMMVSDTAIIHANSHHMAVEIEALEHALERIERAGVGKPTGLRRL